MFILIFDVSLHVVSLLHIVTIYRVYNTFPTSSYVPSNKRGLVRRLAAQNASIEAPTNPFFQRPVSHPYWYNILPYKVLFEYPIIRKSPATPNMYILRREKQYGFTSIPNHLCTNHTAAWLILYLHTWKWLGLGRSLDRLLSLKKREFIFPPQAWY